MNLIKIKVYKFVVIVAFLLLLLISKVAAKEYQPFGGLQNPYQQEWWQAYFYKDCFYNKNLKSCDYSHHGNYKNYIERNKFEPDKIYCIGGKVYTTYGFQNRIHILYSSSETMPEPLVCTKQGYTYYTDLETYYKSTRK